jgi:hypothetical protein
MEFCVDHGLTILSRTPSVLRALLTDLPEEWLRGNEGPETWSPFDIVGHLIHGERTDWMGRARIILEAGEEREFDPFDRFAMFEESRGKSLAELLDTFEELRTENLADLRALELDEDRLGLRGRHPDFGTVTLRQLLSTWVAHDLGHLAAISRTMAKQYRQEVGPWRQYLPVMDMGGSSS